jgi:hypothetical protein
VAFILDCVPLSPAFLVPVDLVAALEADFLDDFDVFAIVIRF